MNPDSSSFEDELYFIYNDWTTSVAAARIDDTGVFVPSTSSGFSDGSRTPYFHYAYVSGAPVPVAIPEIDGSALAKALFILLAFGLWLRTRRGAAA